MSRGHYVNASDEILLRRKISSCATRIPRKKTALTAVVPAYATAPALLFVACLMLRELGEIDWSDTAGRARE